MPACKTTEAEMERRRKISDATRGVSKGPRKPWSVEARAKHSNVVKLRWATMPQEQRDQIGANISTSRGNGAVEDPSSKLCKECNQVRSRVDFDKDRRQKDGLQGACKDCRRSRLNKWAASHPEKVRANRRSRYNVDFNALWLSQGGLCALCSKPLVPRGKGPDSVVIDHDHNCCPPKSGGGCCGKCVRGLLHRDCNLLLGLVEKRRGHLQLAESYLQRWGGVK